MMTTLPCGKVIDQSKGECCFKSCDKGFAKSATLIELCYNSYKSKEKRAANKKLKKEKEEKRRLAKCGG